MTDDTQTQTTAALPETATQASAAANPAPADEPSCGGILSAALAELGKLEHFTQEEVNALWKAIMARL